VSYHIQCISSVVVVVMVVVVQCMTAVAVKAFLWSRQFHKSMVVLMSGGTTWMNWCLYAAVIVAFPLLLIFREQYRRLAVDKRRVISPVSMEVSGEHNIQNHNLPTPNI